MAFPTTGILDDFNRANNADLGANWTPLGSFGALAVNSNQVVGPDGHEYWNPSTFGPDCEVYCTITTAPATDETVSLWLRTKDVGSGATLDGYFGQIYQAAVTPVVTIYRRDNGASTQLGASIDQTFSSGDGFGCEAIGSTLAIYRKSSGTWTQLGTRSDATYGAAGNIGIGVAGIGKLDNAGGGTVVLESGTHRVGYRAF